MRTIIPRNYNGTNAISTASYYSFGMTMPKATHSLNPSHYRYGYQGQFAEKDPETGLNAFDLRLWDARIARWLTTDPANQHWSPYLGMSNNPIQRIDPDGLTDYLLPDGSIKTLVVVMC